MFVLDGKLVELPEEVAGEPMPLLVRLQPFDNHLRARIDAPEPAIEFCRILFRLDGELRTRFDVAWQWRSFVGQGELEGEVVEGRAEVMDTVANDEAEFGGGRWLEDFDPKELLSATSLGCGPSSV